MHQELYGKQVDEEGKFHPGPHAKYDAARLQEQIACVHPCDELLWTGNGAGLFAKCSLCKLKSVIAYKVFDPDSPSQPKAKAKPKAKGKAKAKAKGAVAGGGAAHAGGGAAAVAAPVAAG